MAPSILTFDLETTPIEAFAWALWKQDIGLSQIKAPTRVMSFAGKWYDSKRTIFLSEFHTDGGHEGMVRGAHALLDEADIVVTYNGKKFDTPHMRREFALLGLKPHSPYKEIDLYQVISRQFRFPSNKLAYVTKAFGLPQQKMASPGFETWVKCMEGDPKAWDRMKRYNIQDIRTTEALYERVLPWIPSHPNLALYSDGDATIPTCPNCASTELQSRGTATTALGRYARYQCVKCGKWTRGKKAEAIAEMRPA